MGHFCVEINTGAIQTATEIGVAAFNLAWAGTEADFSKHIEVCTAPTVKWCDSRPKKTKGKEPTKDELARAAKSQAAFAGVAGGAEQAQQVAPCNAYKLTAKKWVAGPDTMYQQKLEGLRGTFDALATEHQIASPVVTTYFGPRSCPRSRRCCINIPMSRSSSTSTTGSGTSWRTALTRVCGWATPSTRT